jgi:hypothetical protein
MKKTALTILLTAMAMATGYAQGAYEAMLFSKNDYEGTARSVAMGNAFTALGGDLGAVSINPAGSAVAGYSQFSFTPSITFSSTTAQGTIAPGSSSLDYFENKYKTYFNRGAMPNLGFVFDFKTGRRSGLKSFSFGFVVNRSNSWCEDYYAHGTNYNTSFAAAAAVSATNNIADLNYGNPEPRYSYKDFLGDDAYYSGMPWRDVVAYQGGIISHLESGEEFIGATEVISDGSIIQGGPVYQSCGRNTYGGKNDYILNFGANISDFIYVGFNLGLVTLNYESTEYLKERAMDKTDFEAAFTDSEGKEYVTYFEDLMYRYNYSATGEGIYGKLGIIVTPGNGFRFGAAIQTPTAMTIREMWNESAATNYSNKQFSASAESMNGDYTYNFSSPFRANFGLAYTLGSMGVISADYELATYGSMRYKIDRYGMADADIEYFSAVNNEIREVCRTAHQLRIGAEFKPVSEFAVRAGYNLMTSAADKTIGNSLALGIGYISKKSFFADLACRYSFATKEYYMPYENYQFDAQDNVINYSPEIEISSQNWKVLLTLGWRF